MIYLITSREKEYNVEELLKNDIVISTASNFKTFIEKQTIIQLDTETNVVDKLFKRELYVVQIGDYNGNEQWIFDITGLSGLKLKYLKDCLNNKNIQKIIHNASFEYTIIKKTWGIDIDKIRDTMLISKILNTGLITPKGFHGLAGCINRYLGIEISKEAQTTFTFEPMTTTQIIYAATDVTLMGKLHEAMQTHIDHWQLENTVKLECAVVRPYSDGLWDNLYLDIDKWKQLMVDREKEVNDLEQQLFTMLREDFLTECEELNFIQKQDTFLFSWGSSKMKNSLMKLAYPILPEDCTALPAYKKFYNSLKEDENNTVNLDVLDMYLKRNFEELEKYFINNYLNELDKLGLFIPKGKININFNSPDQTLQLFRIIEPKLESVDKDTIQKINHPLAKVFRAYKKSIKLSTSYGQNFIDACDEDNMLRIPDINQIINTGRTSMSLFQLLPSSGPYRNCFYPDKDWLVCGIDYSSQELVVAASLSKEPAIIEALTNGWDMHSICASMMFPKEWAACGEDPKPTKKPKTKEGDKFRSWSKAVSFGIMYGKSAIGLAESLDLYANTDEIIEAYPDEVEKLIIDKNEEFKTFCLDFHNSKDNKTSRKGFVKQQRSLGLFLPDEVTGDDLVQRFKTAFPDLNNYLSNNAESAVARLHSRTKDVFGRIRFFEKPEEVKEEKAIFREAMNYPIQSGSANMTKYACVLIKKYIEEHNLQEKVKFLFSIHDEILTKVHKSFAEDWLKIQLELMEKAGEFILDNNLQKAEGGLSDVWTK